MNRLNFLHKISPKIPVFLCSWYEATPNTYYFTGVEEDPFAVLITGEEIIAYGQSNYEFAHQTIPFKKIRKHFWHYLKKHGIRALGVDESDGAFLARLIGKKIKPVPLRKRFLEMRKIKDHEEKQKISMAQEITKACFRTVQEQIFGKSESHVAGLLELEARKRGVRFDAFPPIIASGPNGAIPHTKPSLRNITPGDAVVVDIGVKYHHYCADFTHTIYEGKDKEIRDAVEAVKEAKKAATKKAKTGARGKTLSDVAQRVIEEYDFGKNSFRSIGLRLGHHVGLEVHDGPGLEEDILKKGMVFTIEPGVYVPGKFGVRFEDIVML